MASIGATQFVPPKYMLDKEISSRMLIRVLQRNRMNRTCFKMLSEPEGCVLPELLLAWGRLAFVLLGFSSDWMRPAPIMESNPLRSKCINLNV